MIKNTTQEPTMIISLDNQSTRIRVLLTTDVDCDGIGCAFHRVTDIPDDVPDTPQAVQDFAIQTERYLSVGFGDAVEIMRVSDFEDRYLSHADAFDRRYWRTDNYYSYLAR